MVSIGGTDSGSPRNRQGQPSILSIFIDDQTVSDSPLIRSTQLPMLIRSLTFIIFRASSRRTSPVIRSSTTSMYLGGFEASIGYNMRASWANEGQRIVRMRYSSIPLSFPRFLPPLAPTCLPEGSDDGWDP